MKNYSKTPGKKVMDALYEGFIYLTEEIDNIEEKEWLIPAIQSNLHSYVKGEIKGYVPREIVDKCVNLIFYSFRI